LINSLTQITRLRLIQLRWLFVAAMLVAALVSPNILGSSSVLPQLLAFATVVACLNACLHVAHAFHGDNRELHAIFSPFVQLAFDLGAWSGYIFLSGGATNPLISVLLPLVAVGSLVLSRAQAWLLGALTILAYTFLWRYYLPLPIADAQTATRLHLLGMWLVFVVSALVVIWFILQMTQTVRARDQALAEAREQAIRNDWLVSMGSLAAGAAHELSTPLATLNLLVDELRTDACNAALQEDLDLMKRQVAVCKKALSQLTLRAGNPRGGDQEAVTADDWLQGLLGAWTSLNPAVNVDYRRDAELARWCLPFDVSLERAVANLLDNAMKAGASQIHLQAACEDGSLHLQVEDDGTGIGEAALAAFNEGQPIVSATGMGIGLLLARAACERHGGALTLIRAGERGTRASVSLPVKPLETRDGD
jgi:two-component system, sensor histidine kinase RegB